MPETAHRNRIISVGKLPELLWLRQAILRTVGHEVSTFTDPRDAVSRIEDGKCGVLVLCYSMPEGWRKQLIERFRECCPNGRVVGITNDPVTEPSSDADQLVYGVEGPEILIDAIRGKAA